MSKYERGWGFWQPPLVPLSESLQTESEEAAADHERPPERQIMTKLTDERIAEIEKLERRPILSPREAVTLRLAIRDLLAERKTLAHALKDCVETAIHGDHEDAVRHIRRTYRDLAGVPRMPQL